MTDCNAVAQEKGLAAVLVFVESAQCAGRACGDVLGGLVAKCIAAPRQGTRDLALEVVLMYVEVRRHKMVVEELVRALDNKNTKIVAGCVLVLRECLRLFGSRVVSPKLLFKALPKVRSCGVPVLGAASEQPVQPPQYVAGASELYYLVSNCLLIGPHGP